MFILLYTRDGLTCRHPLRPGDTVVGRAPICDLTIDDPSISRRHVRLRVHGEHCVLTDLGGRNGTFVNGDLVTEAEVKGGDTVVLGRFPLHIEHVAAAPVVLSEHALLSENSPAIIRPIDGETETRAGVAGATPERLLYLFGGITQQLAGSLALAEVIDRTLGLALDTTPADRAILFLVDPSSRDVSPQGARARDGRPIARAAVSRGAVRRAIDEKSAILAAHPLPEASVADTGAHSAAAGHTFVIAPLYLRPHVLGVLYADVPHPGQLDLADLDVLQALAGYAAAAIARARRAESDLLLARRRDQLSRQHASAAVERALLSTDAALAPREREVTLLGAEIGEPAPDGGRLPAARVAAILDQCLGVLIEAVLAEEGTVEAVRGGRMTAIFNAPLEQPDHADRALRAALAIRRGTAALALAPPVRVRVALHSGVVMAGELGPERRRDYAAVGEPARVVDRALLACSAGQITITDATRARLAAAPSLQPRGPLAPDAHTPGVELFLVC